MLPGHGPVLCMIRERHVILKVALHSTRLRFVQKLQHIRLPSSCALYIPNINMRMYITIVLMDMN